MTDIDTLIAHYKARVVEINGEIQRLGNTPEGPRVTSAEIDRWIADWEDSRKICRDTIAYLETIKSRGFVPQIKGGEK